MYKPSFNEVAVMILIGVATVLVLAFTDFGLSGGALAGIFIVLADYGRRARRDTAAS